MTAQTPVDMAVHNIRTVRDLVQRFANTLATAAQHPAGVTLPPEMCSDSAKALESWVVTLDSTLDLLIPPPVAAPAPPPRRAKPRLVALDGEVLP